MFTFYPPSPFLYLMAIVLTFTQHGKSSKKDSKKRSLEDFVVSLQRVSTQHEKST